MEKSPNISVSKPNLTHNEKRESEKHNDAFSKYLVDGPTEPTPEHEDNFFIDTEEQKTSSNPFQLTDPHIPGHAQIKSHEDTIANKKPTTHIYRIEESELPTVFEAPYTPLPSIVEFKRIIGNIMNALKFDRESELEKKNEFRKKTRFEKWKSYLEMEENLAIVSDAFWFAISRFFHRKRDNNLKKTNVDLKYNEIEENLLNRIARNYVNFFLSIDDKFEKDDFFKSYFDILAQAVFYGFFYAFPKSRIKFNDELKKGLLDEFSYQFTGVQISNTHYYMEKWCLDLGAGNIFKSESQNKKNKEKEKQQSLPQVDFIPKTARNKRNILFMRYSPIVERYVKNYKYKTRNYLRAFKMKFTEYDQNQKLFFFLFLINFTKNQSIEERFEKHLVTANTIMAKAKQLKKEAKNEKIAFMNEIKEFKRETVKHQRRLEKRKAEELERGAHEYANYLVSMLNSGITVATLGVGTQKGL